MPVHAAIFVQRGHGAPPPEKQLDACLAYCATERYAVIAIVPGVVEDASALTADGRVTVLVAAYDSRAVQQLAVAVEGHGQVEVVHPEPRVVEPARPHAVRSINELILRMSRRGRTVEQISDTIDAETTDVRAILRRYGEDPGRSR